ncbi:MAG: thioredoxin domain-containing protein [Proteobacteria bacterium]|nr:thioredoxin domain-containing protein [Pseudomonadota bacterium]
MSETPRPTQTNRLAAEKSPYLLQHAANPVDWYPWSREAFERSVAHDKPILLSVGYSACHWCHVMAHECFEDKDIAAQMNELFINIKVDREERPDVDQVYQLVVQLLGRSGGWPLTVFLTPERKPFFGGTYFPPQDRYGMPGFPTVLSSVARGFREQRSELERSAAEVTRRIAEIAAPGTLRAEPAESSLRTAVSSLRRQADEQHGGFGDAPKFPNSMNLELLLRGHRRGFGSACLEHVRRSLDRMRAGGIYDQLGGGFHRYSTDARWLVPHFEKMLYDNALLTRIYLDAFRATGEERYADTVRETLAYVQREMLSPEGAFFATQDADSEGREGVFFVWNPKQLERELQPDEARAAALLYGVSEEGNFEEGQSVLHENRPLAAVAKQLDRSEPQVQTLLSSARHKLWQARERRPRPFRDEKILASWNGLMIGAVAEAGGALGEPGLVETAARALSFCRGSLMQQASLSRIYMGGASATAAFLDDYANLANAAIDVYENSFEESALEFADELVQAALDRFWDWEHSVFWYTPAGGEALIVRCQDVFDGAVPSATSSMCRAMLRLHALGGQEQLLQRVELVLRALGPRAADNPMGYGNLLCVMDSYFAGATQIVLVGKRSDPALQDLARAVRGSYLPHRALLFRPSDAPRTALPWLPDFAATLEARDGRATAYVCRQRSCSAPVTDPEQLMQMLAESGVG